MHRYNHHLHTSSVIGNAPSHNKLDSVLPITSFSIWAILFISSILFIFKKTHHIFLKKVLLCFVSFYLLFSIFVPIITYLIGLLSAYESLNFFCFLILFISSISFISKKINCSLLKKVFLGVVSFYLLFSIFISIFTYLDGASIIESLKTLGAFLLAFSLIFLPIYIPYLASKDYSPNIFKRFLWFIWCFICCWFIIIAVALLIQLVLWIFHLYEDGQLWSTILGVGGVIGAFWLYIAFIGSFRGYGESSNSSRTSNSSSLSYNFNEPSPSHRVNDNSSNLIKPSKKMISSAKGTNSDPFVVYVYDETGNVLYSKWGTLVGYTSSSVSVKEAHGIVYVYDETGNFFYSK